MEIRRSESESKGRYSTDNGGEMTFSSAGAQLIIIDHTEVPRSLAGQGVGVALVRQAVDDARAEGRKILPLCPFAAAQFRKHPEWQDALPGVRDLRGCLSRPEGARHDERGVGCTGRALVLPVSLSNGLAHP